MVAIIDYGMGNIHSVNKALKLYGARTLVTSNQEEIKSAQKLVLPGVGAFGDAMLELERLGLIQCIKEGIKSEKPFLGICLGMQLLFESSEEAKGQKGLGIFKGTVKKFNVPKKVPHMGWNMLNKIAKDCPLFKGIPEGSFAYFCHSYFPDPKDKDVIASYTDYGINFASCLWQENVFGVQFHPEKSQSVGLRMIENFVKIR